MCGIAGFADQNRNSSEEILLGMCNTLAHRGPDGQGKYFFQNEDFQAGLGHRRLSIIDLSENGAQPMRLGNYHITYNGEIYNYREIKAELTELGHKFYSNSDTEVILAAYSEWKHLCLQKFIGMFSFVIFDEQKREFFCARDRAGVKPFYYYIYKGLFLFASELKAFHRHPAFSKKINQASLQLFVQFGNVPGSNCIFEHCYKLPPAHYMLFKPGGEPKIVSYWNVYNYYNSDKLELSFEEAKTQTEKLILSAAKYRMVSDVPVGIFLSGGYDSACLTALLQKNSSEKIRTFTIGVEEMGLDEAPFAREIAKRLGTNHEEYYCTHKDALELIPDLQNFYDEPFADQSAIPTTLVSRIARKSVKVALSADGGDEIFAGYNRYGYMMKEGKYLRNMPSVLRKGLVAMMNKISADKIPVLRDTYNFHYRYQKSKLLLQDPSPQNIMFRLSKQFNDDEISELFLHPVQDTKTAYQSNELKEKNFSPLSYMMAIDYQTYLPDDILQKVDRASMSQSLEAREPFLDHRLIEWAARLPDEFKYNRHVKKYILRQIVHQYIPKEMMDRPKMGFAVPLDKWLMNDLKEQLMYFLDEKKIDEQGFFQPKFAVNLRDKFLSGNRELATRVWYLLTFGMWYERWMERAQAV